MVYQDNGTPSPAVEKLAIIEDDDEVMSERVPSFATEFINILQRVAKQGDRCATSQLVELLTDASFDLSILRGHIKSVADKKYATIRNTRKLMKDDGVPKVLVRDTLRRMTAPAHYT